MILLKNTFNLNSKWKLNLDKWVLRIKCYGALLNTINCLLSNFSTRNWINWYCSILKLPFYRFTWFWIHLEVNNYLFQVFKENYLICRTEIVNFCFSLLYLCLFVNTMIFDNFMYYILPRRDLRLYCFINKMSLRSMKLSRKYFII